MVADLAAREAFEVPARQFAELLERYAPGLVAQLHLIGSAADGDFHPGRSDLDFVAVLAHPATDAGIDALAIAHRLYSADPTFPWLDGIWITAEELAAGPDATLDGPTTRDGQFFATGRGNRNPIAWYQLQDAVTVIGTLDRSALWSDAARLASWTRDNVGFYWRAWHAQSGSFLTARGLAMLGRRAPMWGVLGISRLHYTLAAGKIASKTDAGEYALGWVEPRWRRILEECLLARRRAHYTLYPNPLSRRRDALDYVAMVMGAIEGGGHALAPG